MNYPSKPSINAEILNPPWTFHEPSMNPLMNPPWTREWKLREPSMNSVNPLMNLLWTLHDSCEPSHPPVNLLPWPLWTLSGTLWPLHEPSWTQNFCEPSVNPLWTFREPEFLLWIPHLTQIKMMKNNEKNCLRKVILPSCEPCEPSWTFWKSEKNVFALI